MIKSRQNVTQNPTSEMPVQCSTNWELGLGHEANLIYGGIVEQ